MLLPNPVAPSNPIVRDVPGAHWAARVRRWGFLALTDAAGLLLGRRPRVPAFGIPRFNRRRSCTCNSPRWSSSSSSGTRGPAYIPASDWDPWRRCSGSATSPRPGFSLSQPVFIHPQIPSTLLHTCHFTNHIRAESRHHFPISRLLILRAARHSAWLASAARHHQHRFTGRPGHFRLASPKLP